MKTTMARKEQVQSGEIDRKWYVVDAEDMVLGRLAARIATILRGKNKPIFTPHVDVGDFVVIVNAEKVKLTGNKLTQKMYYRYSGYNSGLKATSAGAMLKHKPTELLRHAVKGMMPKSRLGRAQLSKLKVYAGADHPHEAQQPEPLPQ
jgi:large subunit ribosomal protein L13